MTEIERAEADYRKDECWGGRFAGPVCQEKAVWLSTAPLTAGMSWCNAHAPRPDYRKPWNESEAR